MPGSTEGRERVKSSWGEGLGCVIDLPHYRLDDLRRFATASGTALGVPPARAAELASHLLWFDAAGLSAFGIATLPAWLERIEARSVEAAAEGRVTAERTSLVVLDGQNGIPPLILARAGELAVEKARDSGVGIVRVSHLGPTGPAAVVAAEMAVGPVAAVILGPGPSWTCAFPSAEGLPAVFDSALGPRPGGTTTRSRWAAPPDPGPMMAPWIAAMAPEGGWLIAAIAVAALESLATFHERVGATLDAVREWPGGLLPGPWEARRRIAREAGVPLAAEAMTPLTRWGDRLGVEPLARVDAPRPES